MAERFTTWIKTSLNKTLPPVQTIDGVMFARDNAANEIIVELYKDGNKVLIPTDGSYATSGFITILDEDTSTSYEISGTITSTGEAKVVIPANSAYAKQCVIEVAIRLYSDRQSNNKWGYAAVIAAFRCKVEDPILTNTAVIIPEPVADMTAYLGRIQTMIDHFDSTVAEVRQMEQSYSSAEASRVQAESGRVNAEASRVQAESGRVNAEASRVQADQQRTIKNDEAVAKIDNMTVSATARRVEYYVQPEAFATISLKSNPDRKHIDFDFGLRDGVGVNVAELTNDYKLRIGMTNGTEYVSGNSLRGPRGETAYGMVVESYEESDRLLTLNNTANNSHIFDDDVIPYEYIDDLFRTL